MALKAKFVRREALTKTIQNVVPEAEKAYSEAIATGARELAQAIQSRAPRDQGDYARSIEAARIADRPQNKQLVGINQTKDPNAWGIFANWKWRFLEFGTRAHVIKARRGGFLRFIASDGARVRTRQVSHPGARRQPHIFPTYRAYRKRIRRRVANAINKALKQKFGGKRG